MVGYLQSTDNGGINRCGFRVRFNDLLCIIFTHLKTYELLPPHLSNLPPPKSFRDDLVLCE